MALITALRGYASYSRVIVFQVNLQPWTDIVTWQGRPSSLLNRSSFKVKSPLDRNVVFQLRGSSDLIVSNFSTL